LISVVDHEGEVRMNKGLGGVIDNPDHVVITFDLTEGGSENSLPL
jgi:hypothetical protein